VKKIAIVTHNMSFGGVQRVVKNLLFTFKKDFEIVLILFEQKKIAFPLPENIKILYLEEKKFDYQNLIKQDQASIITFGEELFNFRVDSLCEILNYLELDLIISHEDYDNLIVKESLEKLGLKTKTILTSHLFLDSYKDKLIHLLPWSFYENGIKKHYKNSTVVSVSSGVTSGLKELEVDAITIENGVDISEAIAKADEPLEIEITPFILCIGRIEFAQKGQDDLLKAYAKIAGSIPQKLLFVGEGKDKAKLEALVAESGLNERVEILGFQSNPFVFMKHADLVAFPSYFEGLPNTILEALAVGAAIVSYDFEPSAKEISASGRYFPLVKRGDIEGLAEEMAAILGDAETLESWRGLAKERAEAYGLEAMIGKWSGVIDASAHSKQSTVDKW